MKMKSPINQYLVSAIFLDMNVVTHFAVHEYYNPGVGGAHKLSMAQMKKLFERDGVSVFIAEWNYQEGKFIIAQQAFMKKFNENFHFYIEPEDYKTKNLRHLINLSWYEDYIIDKKPSK